MTDLELTGKPRGYRCVVDEAAGTATVVDSTITDEAVGHQLGRVLELHALTTILELDGGVLLAFLKPDDHERCGVSVLRRYLPGSGRSRPGRRHRLPRDHIASAKRVSDEWVLTIYDHGGAGERHVPLDGMIRALQEASERLEQRS